MKRNLYLDPTTNDIVLDATLNLRVTQTYTEWLSQKIENVLKTFEGEWFANQEIGIPYFRSILKKGVNPTEVNAIFRNAILNIDGVSEILEFEVTYDTAARTYSISPLKIRSKEGEEITIEEIII